MNQSKAYEEWQYKCQQLQDLGSVIQNDFDNLREDGYIQSDTIQLAREDFFTKYTQLQKEINILARRICNILSNEVY